MYNLINLLFVNYLFLIFPISSSNIKNDQRILVESKQDVFRLFGSNINYPLIKLIKMELKKLNENQQNVTEIIIELSEEMKNKEFYISIFQDPCYETAWTNSYNTNNAVIGENGKKQMRIEREYTNYYKHGILICGLGDLLGTVSL
ncbi:hypothetical protein ACQ4LE_010912 [Meloidogyne hapla]